MYKHSRVLFTHLSLLLQNNFSKRVTQNVFRIYIRFTTQLGLVCVRYITSSLLCFIKDFKSFPVEKGTKSKVEK